MRDGEMSVIRDLPQVAGQRTGKGDGIGFREPVGLAPERPRDPHPPLGRDVAGFDELGRGLDDGAASRTVERLGGGGLDQGEDGEDREQ